MKKNVLIGIGSFLLGAMLFIGLSTTLAADNNSANSTTGNKQEVRAQFNAQNREAIQTALQNGDYNTWKSLMEGTKMGDELLTKVNEGNFARFAEAHKIMEEARVKSQAIFDELGIEKPQGPDGKGRGEGGPKGGCPCQNNQTQATTQTQ